MQSTPLTSSCISKDVGELKKRSEKKIRFVTTLDVINQGRG